MRISYQDQGNHLEAISDFSVCLAFDQSRDDVRLLRGKLYLKILKPALALADFDLLINRYPRDEELHLFRAAAVRQLG